MCFTGILKDVSKIQTLQKHWAAFDAQCDDNLGVNRTEVGDEATSQVPLFRAVAGAGFLSDKRAAKQCTREKAGRHGGSLMKAPGDRQ